MLQMFRTVEKVCMAHEVHRHKACDKRHIHIVSVLDVRKQISENL